MHGTIATEHAVIELTKDTALDYAKQGIRVNAVATAAIETPMLDRFPESVPREIAAAVV